MPYFQWRGVDITGAYKGGKLFAKSATHLDSQLLKRGIALLKTKPVRFQLFGRPISLAHKVQLFRQLSVLINAGVLLPDALTIVADQFDQPRLQEVVHTLADNVHEGISLSKALCNYPKLFDAMIVQQIRVGEESDNLADALDALSNALEMHYDFQQKLHSTLMIPCMTLGFFVCVALVIFVFIVPRFAQLFATVQKDIPPLTATMLNISTTLRSPQIFIYLVSLFLVGLLVRIYAKSAGGKQKLDQLLIQIPFIGTLIKYRFLANFLQSLAMLLKGGMQLVPALQVIYAGTTNIIFKKQIEDILQSVDAGSSLSAAMLENSDSLFSQDVIAMVTIGQESGQLIGMLQKVAALYHEKVKRQLTLSTTALQPLLMIILGLLITALIFAVYGPIFNLASAIG